MYQMAHSGVDVVRRKCFLEIRFGLAQPLPTMRPMVPTPQPPSPSFPVVARDIWFSNEMTRICKYYHLYPEMVFPD